MTIPVEEPEPGRKVDVPRFDYSIMLLALLGFMVILGMLWESRWYFLNLLSGPADMTLAEIAELPSNGLRRNWIRVKCPEILNSGYQTVLKQSWGDSKVENTVQVVSSLKVIPVGKRFLAANVPVHQPGSVLVGALLPLPDDTRLVLGKGLTRKEFDELVLPFILETDAYHMRSAVFRILCAVLGLAVCAMIVVGQIRRRRRHIQTSRSGVEPESEDLHRDDNIQV